MTEDIRLSKVEILIQQNKFTEAEKILSDLLTEDSNNIHYLTLLAEVYFQQENFENATSIIDNAIGISPDAPYLFYLKARIGIQLDNFDDAENNINQAIELDPYDADYFAVLANIKMARKLFEEALQTADQALEIDPENLLALNIRSSALNKLNRSQESFETIEGALREDPNNAFTHANYGWGLLEQGNHKKALEHFKEALSNDPNLSYAQSGMIEAIKASNPVYRLFLKYSFFMSNLSEKYQWGVLIGFYIVSKLLISIARNNESFQPYLFPLIVTLALFAFSTWVIGPVSNLFLRFNKYGHLLLDKNEKLSSNLVAVSLGVAITGALLYFVLSEEKMLLFTVFGFAMMLPLGTMLSSSKNKMKLVIFTIALALVGLIAIGISFTSGESLNMMALVFVVGFKAYQWVANYMAIKEDNP